LKDEAETNIVRDEANKLRETCQAELDRVLPMLEEAAKALDKITKDNVNTMKSYPKPPTALDIVM
jgi:dynein heavy chain, axonemal